MREKICYKPIGVIRTPFRSPEGMPIQPAGGEDITGTVEIFPEFAPGLRDIEGFTRIVLIYHFHQSNDCSLEVIPFLDTRPHGIFATRAPSRPNPIGFSIVELLEREGSRLLVSGIDILDGTPLLDIKPYIPGCDAFTGGKAGWFPADPGHFNHTRSDDRFLRRS